MKRICANTRSNWSEEMIKFNQSMKLLSNNLLMIKMTSNFFSNTKLIFVFKEFGCLLLPLPQELLIKLQNKPRKGPNSNAWKNGDKIVSNNLLRAHFTNDSYKYFNKSTKNAGKLNILIDLCIYQTFNKNMEYFL